MFEVIVLDGSGSRYTLREGGELTVGAAVQSDIRLTASDVSRSHALISCHRGKVGLLDLGSKNGTFVNGSRITEAQVGPGDVVRFSSVTVQVLPAGESSSGDPVPEMVPGAEANATSEHAPARVEETIVSLLERWQRPATGAVDTLLEWVAREWHLGGAAALEVPRVGDVAVLGAVGEMSSVLLGDAVARALRGRNDHRRGLEIAELDVGPATVLAVASSAHPWLVLAATEAPAMSHLHLFMALLGVARRIDAKDGNAGAR